MEKTHNPGEDDMSAWLAGLESYGRKYGYSVEVYVAGTREEIAFYDLRDHGKIGPIANASKGVGGEIYGVYHPWPHRTLVKNESNFRRHLRKLRR